MHVFGASLARLMTLAGPLSLCLLTLVAMIEVQAAGTLYSYTDDKGVKVITDNFDRIPIQYRASVITVPQEPEQRRSRIPTAGQLGAWLNDQLGVSGKHGFDIPGMSPKQDEILTYAGALALLSLIAMNLSRSQGIRFLAMWCLIMLLIGTPVLLYVSDDGPGNVMQRKAEEARQKQQNRLSQAQ